MKYFIKFYAAHYTTDNYLYVFKVQNRQQAINAIPRILNKFQKVRAIYFASEFGLSQQIYSSKK